MIPLRSLAILRSSYAVQYHQGFASLAFLSISCMHLHKRISTSIEERLSEVIAHLEKVLRLHCDCGVAFVVSIRGPSDIPHANKLYLTA